MANKIGKPATPLPPASPMPPAAYCTVCGKSVYAEYSEDGVTFKCVGCGSTIGDDGAAVPGTQERVESRGAFDRG